MTITAPYPTQMPVLVTEEFINAWAEYGEAYRALIGETGSTHSTAELDNCGETRNERLACESLLRSAEENLKLPVVECAEIPAQWQDEAIVKPDFQQQRIEIFFGEHKPWLGPSEIDLDQLRVLELHEGQWRRDCEDWRRRS